jgi:hypothetical protein
VRAARARSFNMVEPQGSVAVDAWAIVWHTENQLSTTTQEKFHKKTRVAFMLCRLRTWDTCARSLRELYICFVAQKENNTMTTYIPSCAIWNLIQLQLLYAGWRTCTASSIYAAISSSCFWYRNVLVH